jgi:elongation factor G
MTEKHLPRDVRDIALAGHAGAGKTSLAEAVLFVAGCSERLGKVDDGTATTDFEPDETKRKMSISLAMAPCAWNGRALNWVDTPGYPDFFGDFVAALRVVDDVLLVTPAQNSGGVEFGLETAWDMAREAGKAEALFINKMDRENADFFGAVNAFRDKWGAHVVPAVIPIGAGDTFRGVVDLVTMKAYVGSGRDVKEEPIPHDLQATAEEWRQLLIEVAAEGDDALIEEFLEGKELTEDQIERGIHADLLGGKIVPVFCGSATKVIGIQPLLTHLAIEFESPEEAPVAAGTHPQTGKSETRPCDPAAPFSALIFKTVADPYVGKLTYFRVKSGTLKSDSHVWNANKEKEERVGPLFRLRGKTQEPVTELVAGDLGAVAKLAVSGTGDTLCDRNKPVVYEPIPFPEPTFALAVHPKSKGDEDKLGAALARIVEEDPCFRTRRDADTHETLLLGQGETHLDVVVGRMARFGAQVTTSQPRVPYRETVTKSARAQGRHKKQTGGRGQFGDCWLTVEPNETGAGFAFVDKVVGGAIPRQYIPAVEKGVQQAMTRGILAGFPVVDVRAIVDDGSFHPVDSSEAAFIMAGIQGFTAAARNAGPILLEPVLDVTITAPDTMTGDLMGDINGRRGHVVGIEPSVKGGYQTIRAQIPQAEMPRYAVDLRSLARGRATFSATASHYAEVPAHIAQPLIADYEKRKAEGHVSSAGHE